MKAVKERFIASLSQEFYDKQEALRYGEKLSNFGFREFVMSRYTTNEGQAVWFFDWASSFSTQEAIHAEWN